MKKSVLSTTLRYDYCIGCGICSISCPADAITMKWTKNRELKPTISGSKCTNCGMCIQFCPHTMVRVISEAKKVSGSSDPNSFGLQEAEYLLAHDIDETNRKKSASGGAVTAIIKHLFDTKTIDGVIHAKMCQGKIGETHYKASLSLSYEESDNKRSSCYGTIDYSEIIKNIKNDKKTYLIVGVPCTIRALVKLFEENSRYYNIKIITIALSCSHNVNGQYIDFLAESLNIQKDQIFTVNLRNKDGIKDANNYNNHFYTHDKDIIKINRFKSIFTDIWRNYFFAMNICHYCSDFWGYAADISAKDAWGKWADNPLGGSILIIRNKELFELIIKNDNITYEHLDFDDVANSQLDTTEYKQVRIMDRLNKSIFHKDNIKSGFLKYSMLCRWSKLFYSSFGYGFSKKVLFIMLKILQRIEKSAVNRSYSKKHDKKTQIKNIITRSKNKKVIFLGTGQMAKKLKKVLRLNVAYYIDNDVKKQNTLLDGILIQNPNCIVNEDKDNILIIIASMYYDQIARQLEEMGFSLTKHFIDGRPIYESINNKTGFIVKQTLQRLKFIFNSYFTVFGKIKKIFIYEKTGIYKKILILGGYGYKNTGDEAQLSATLKLLKEEFPDFMIKVLTPDQHYTYLEHGRCLVGEAPRTAFYDVGETSLYSLDSSWKKLKFIIISLCIYANAFLVRANLPTFFINAKKAALIYDIYTSDMVYFSGGGYLTGKTLSRLWDGMFFIRIADALKVPVFLSGQTIGVWQNNFNKRLAKWGLSKAKIITLRDPAESLEALKEIGISGEHVFTTFDDALFCERIQDEAQINRILKSSGIDEKDVDKGFITFNIHYWGIEKASDRALLIDKINSIVNVVLERTQYKILFIPMIPSDEEAINDYMLRYGNSRVYALSYDYNFRAIRSTIGKSQLCITMKHHPIIFALGEKVPVISLALSDYYEHKNIGALRIFGLEKYNILLSDQAFLEHFLLLFDSAKKNNNMIGENGDIKFNELKKKKADFIAKIKDITVYEHKSN